MINKTTTQRQQTIKVMQKLLGTGMQIFYKTLLPHHCLLCQQTNSQLFCYDCEQQLPWLQHACYRCAHPTSHPNQRTEAPCTICLKNQFYFTRSLALLHYQQPVSKFIKQLKFHHQLAIADWLGLKLSQRISQAYQNDPLPQFIIPMPLHTKRMRQRGYNQAMEVARTVSKRLAIPIQRNGCQRVRYTMPQAQLSAEQRIKNVQRAFAIDGKVCVNANHVAIIDDVITTGHTANALSQVLCEHGIKRVDLWCCARAS